MNRGTLVCVTGLDGTGKSTLTANVVAALREQGYDAVRAYGRYLPKLTYPIITIGRHTVFIDTDIKENYEEHQSAKKEFFNQKTLSALYEALVMIDYAPQFVYRVLLPLYRHEIVVCDRYVYDTLLTDLAGDVIKEPAEAISRYKFYLKFLPEPKHEFYIHVPTEVSVERKNDIPSIRYLEDRKHFYDAFATAFGLSVLDGTQSVNTLTQEVTETIIESYH